MRHHRVIVLPFQASKSAGFPAANSRSFQTFQTVVFCLSLFFGSLHSQQVHLSLPCSSLDNAAETSKIFFKSPGTARFTRVLRPQPSLSQAILQQLHWEPFTTDRCGRNSVSLYCHLQLCFARPQKTHASAFLCCTPAGFPCLVPSSKVNLRTWLAVPGLKHNFSVESGDGKRCFGGGVTEHTGSAEASAAGEWRGVDGCTGELSWPSFKAFLAGSGLSSGASLDLADTVT